MFKIEYVVNTFKHATGRDDNISHYSVEVDVDVTKKLRASFKYTRSQLVDLFMQQEDLRDVPFYHHDNIYAMVMEDLTGHIILRTAMMQGKVYPKLANIFAPIVPRAAYSRLNRLGEHEETATIFRG